MTPSELIENLNAGLGTDGMQGNMLAEAKEGSLIRSSHLPGGAPGVNYAELLFKNNPAIATKLFNRKIGKLDPGYSADLAIFDYHPKTQFHADNWIGHTLFGMNKPRDVMIAGQFRIRESKLIDLNENSIQINAAEQAQYLWKTMDKILVKIDERNSKKEQ